MKRDRKNQILLQAGLVALTLNFFVSQPVLSGPAPGTNSTFSSVSAAANAGDAEAQYALARKYEKAEGVQRDYTNAVHYARLSADQGFLKAQVLLGSYYARGLGVPKDIDQAVQWYRKAAERGDGLAEYAMAGFCAGGRSVPKDMDQAVLWMQKAAAQDLPEAEDALGQLLFAQGATNATAYVEAAKWLRKAADNGYGASMNNLAVIYDAGLGVKPDIQEAAKWYRTAAESGNVKAQGNLGVLYLDGRGVTNDLFEAYIWFKISAVQGGGVGKKYLYDYETRELLTPTQMAEADQEATRRLEKIRARANKGIKN